MGFYNPRPTIHGLQPTAYSPQPTIHSLQPTAYNPRLTIHGLQSLAIQSTAYNPQPTIHGHSILGHSIHGLQSTAYHPQLYNPRLYNPRPTIHSLLLLSFHRCHLRHLRYLIPESVDRCGQVDMNSLTRANTRAFTRTGYSFSLKNIYFCAIKRFLSCCPEKPRYGVISRLFSLDNLCGQDKSNRLSL